MGSGGIDSERRRGPTAELAAVERHSLRMPPTLLFNTPFRKDGPTRLIGHASLAAILKRPGLLKFLPGGSTTVQKPRTWWGSRVRLGDFELPAFGSRAPESFSAWAVRTERTGYRPCDQALLS